MRRRILYIGRESGTCLHRARALSRLGHDVQIVNPFDFLPAHPLVNLWIWKAGCLFLGKHVERELLAQQFEGPLDLVWVDCGELVGPSLVRKLRKRFGCPIVNLNVDDPYGNRDGAKWRLFLKAIPDYDLLVVPREPNVSEAYARGARKVMRISFSADEVAHSQRRPAASPGQTWHSEVLFVGTWMPERGPFLARLVELGIPLAIYGDRWRRASEWPILQKHWRGDGLYNDSEYASVIESAKVCLGLLSKGNRDLSTTRTFEIPSLGRPLCAERTPEHTALYAEGEEAEFWETPEECAYKCNLLLADDQRRETLATKGRLRFIRNRKTNEAVLGGVLARFFANLDMQQDPQAVVQKVS